MTTFNDPWTTSDGRKFAYAPFSLEEEVTRCVDAGMALLWTGVGPVYLYHATASLRFALECPEGHELTTARAFRGAETRLQLWHIVHDLAIHLPILPIIEVTR